MANALATPSKESEKEVIGLIPAAGLATRLAPLPCSKELYPVGFWSEYSGQQVHPKAVWQYLLEKMRLAGISKAYFILRQGNGTYLPILAMAPPWGCSWPIYCLAQVEWCAEE